MPQIIIIYCGCILYMLYYSRNLGGCFMITRSILPRIHGDLFKGKAIIITGPRQSGKTTLIKLLLEQINEPAIVWNGDEPDIRELLSNCTSTKLKAYIGTHKLVVIDEAQRIPNIGLTLKLITDQIPNVQVIASGSSSFLLAQAINEPLTGRKYEYTLYPLTFSELSSHFGMLEEKRLLEHRLIYGAYPEIVTSQGEEKRLVKLLAESYAYKDIYTLEKIKYPVLLEKILRALALQLGNEVSFNELAQLVHADRSTVERYIQLLEQSFILFKLPAYNKNIRNEIKQSRKIYFYDLGIRNALLGNFSPLALRNDTGALWENYIVVERLKLLRYSESSAQSYFWRTTQQQEIDYIEETNNSLAAYECKWNPTKKVRFPSTFTSHYMPTKTAIITPGTYEDFLSLPMQS